MVELIAGRYYLVTFKTRYDSNNTLTEVCICDSDGELYYINIMLNRSIHKVEQKRVVNLISLSHVIS